MCKNLSYDVRIQQHKSSHDICIKPHVFIPNSASEWISVFRLGLKICRTSCLRKRGLLWMKFGHKFLHAAPHCSMILVQWRHYYCSCWKLCLQTHKKTPNPSRYANGEEYYWDPPVISERGDTTNRRAFCLVQDWDCGPGCLASGICYSDGVWSLVTEHDRHA